MRISAFLLSFVVVVVFSFGFAAPSHAQATRTWVSGVGDDANPCSRTAPCKTFAGAISKTAVFGEINCLDPAGFGAVTITKSITIDCHEVYGSVLNSGTNGIVIAYDSFTDARKTVRLRNLIFNGADTGLNGIRIIGANTAGSAVFIEDCLIDGNFGGSARGISDERSGGGELSVSRTTVRNTGATGIVIVPATGTVRIDATIDSVYIQNSNIGFGLTNGMKALVSRSVISGNTATGVQVDGGGELHLTNSVVNDNGTGVAGGGTIRLNNNDITFNTTGISTATQSYGNNRIAGNGSAGTAPSLIGANSPPFGQQ